MPDSIDQNDNPDSEPRQQSAADRYVGSRIRMRRIMLGMTQEQLASVLGISFQQLQKYEHGANRVSASRLFQLARLLDVQVSFFFEGLSAKAAPGASDARSGKANAGSVAARDDIDAQVMEGRETLELVRAYYRVPDPAIRHCLLALVNALATPAAYVRSASQDEASKAKGGRSPFPSDETRVEPAGEWQCPAARGGGANTGSDCQP